jgi:predicted small lipoprotein YifL
LKRRIGWLSVAVLAGLAMGGCGLRGSLERPVPLWGDPPIEGPNDPRILKQEEERRAAEAKAKEDARRAADAAAPAPSTPPPPTQQ